MAKIKVNFTVNYTTTIDWPDDEMDDLTYENLECNLDIHDAHKLSVDEIKSVKVNGKEHYF